MAESPRREEQDAIGLRPTPTGPEASIEGRPLYVWQIIETVRACGGDEQQAADSLGLRPEQVRTAVEYYAKHTAEIDRLIGLTYETADRARQLSERRGRRSTAEGSPRAEVVREAARNAAAAHRRALDNLAEHDRSR